MCVTPINSSTITAAFDVYELVLRHFFNAKMNISHLQYVDLVYCRLSQQALFGFNPGVTILVEFDHVDKRPCKPATPGDKRASEALPIFEGSEVRRGLPAVYYACTRIIFCCMPLVLTNQVWSVDNDFLRHRK